MDHPVVKEMICSLWRFACGDVFFYRIPICKDLLNTRMTYSKSAKLFAPKGASGKICSLAPSRLIWNHMLTSWISVRFSFGTKAQVGRCNPLIGQNMSLGCTLWIKLAPSRGRKGRCLWSVLLCAKFYWVCRGVLCTGREVHSTSSGQYPPCGLSYASSSRHSSSGLLALAGGRYWRVELGRPEMQEVAPASSTRIWPQII